MMTENMPALTGLHHENKTGISDMRRLTAAMIVHPEKELAALCKALLARSQELTSSEWRLTRALRPAAASLTSIEADIRSGGDPLGEMFLQLRSAERRRELGATYTPAPIVESMLRWAADRIVPERIVDPGAGSGRFLVRAAEFFPHASLIAIEQDPLAALMLRANLAVRGLLKRATVIIGDYCATDLPTISGRSLFIGNPPYVRHHRIPPSAKNWFGRAAKEIAVPASKLAGLHVYFFVRTAQLAAPGDAGAFITSSEWLDVNYGVTVRKLMANRLGGMGLHVIDAKVLPFSNTMTTATIACFEVGSPSKQMCVRSIEKLDALNGLACGTPVDRKFASSTARWSVLLRGSSKPPVGYIELGEIFRVHRGQVTGGNDIWIAGEHASGLPPTVLYPAVTRERELLKLRNAGDLRKIIDLPQELAEIPEEFREAVQQFLRYAHKRGAHESYTARHRKRWWSVGLKPPAPILVGYMARRAPTFARNICRARHINIAHGLYPREAVPEHLLDRLTKWLNENVRPENGRTYAGGLVKFEPKELERIPVPSLKSLPS